MRLERHQGFTLMEMVIVIAVLGLIAVAIAPLLTEGFNVFFTAQDLTTASAQGRLALATLQRDINEIRSPSDITQASATSLAFVLMGNSSVSYTLTSTSNALSAITYTYNGTTLFRNGQILATSIGGFSLSYYASDGNNITALTSSSGLDSIRYVGISLDIKTKFADTLWWMVINGRDL